MTSAPGNTGSNAAMNTAVVKKIIVLRIILDGNQALYRGLESKARRMLYTVAVMFGTSMYTKVAGYANVVKLPMHDVIELSVDYFLVFIMYVQTHQNLLELNRY